MTKRSEHEAAREMNSKIMMKGQILLPALPHRARCASLNKRLRFLIFTVISRNASENYICYLFRMEGVESSDNG